MLHENLHIVKLKNGIQSMVKNITPEILRNKKLVKTFIEEIEAWINFGLHPHIANCFYVKKVEG